MENAVNTSKTATIHIYNFKNVLPCEKIFESDNTLLERYYRIRNNEKIQK